MMFCYCYALDSGQNWLHCLEPMIKLGCWSIFISISVSSAAFISMCLFLP